METFFPGRPARDGHLDPLLPSAHLAVARYHEVKSHPLHPRSPKPAHGPQRQLKDLRGHLRVGAFPASPAPQNGGLTEFLPKHSLRMQHLSPSPSDAVYCGKVVSSAHTGFDRDFFRFFGGACNSSAYVGSSYE